MLAILGAEYVLGLLPRGTHDWNKFIKPEELEGWLDAAGIGTRLVNGMVYVPGIKKHGQNIGTLNLSIFCKIFHGFITKHSYYRKSVDKFTNSIIDGMRAVSKVSKKSL